MMGFRMTDSPFPRKSLNIATDVDGFRFHQPPRHEPRFNARLAIPDGAETVAFGYPARALVFEQRVRMEPLAIRDMRRR